MRTLFVVSIAFLVTIFLCNAQTPQTHYVTVKDIAAKKIKYKGNFIQALSWEDKNGENLIILTETEMKEGKEEKDGRSKELYAFHYIDKSTNTFQQLRQIYDFEKDCPFDVMVDHVAGSLSVTDLDKDGFAEITFLYTVGCRSDVSPDVLKLMMLENGEKYAIRGRTVLYENGSPMKDYAETPAKVVDASFNKAPKAFLDYANKQWEQFKIVKMGE
ncbi:hypothetical protein QNI19_32820 [Cytophagaceae bacterium DM2B3-1]|uniref:Uncharacterized protein n=1 Tax=Xanthocytophaga flava TaxID=3048013 RepID=A0ABT7CVM7_9BACT|nr:hypothetical protein [Xanthocytophaga flavus]MDJ1497770.1 hypothetical protein [Xanthocytophaga flavus]